jgi:hypothetical protein
MRFVFKGLIYVLAPTCFGSSLPSSGSFLDPSDLPEVQIEWVLNHIMCSYVACVHIERMPDTAISKKMYGKLYVTRRRGRPKMRWLDDVSTDLRKMGINEWRGIVRDRDVWRPIGMEAKAHPGL